ncbi:MAG: hypothetical protein WAN50_05320 [Minisyncoccia bacterium]
MEILIIILLVLLLTVLILFFWKEWSLFNNTQIELLYRITARSDFEIWRKKKEESLSEDFTDVEIEGFGLKFDTRTKDCLIARRYKYRVESEEGWENEIVWEILDLKSGERLDKIFWGTASPDSVAEVGNRKKSPAQIKRDLEEKERADKLLRGFKFIGIVDCD